MFLAGGMAIAYDMDEESHDMDEESHDNVSSVSGGASILFFQEKSACRSDIFSSFQSQNIMTIPFHSCMHTFLVNWNSHF